MQLLSTSSPSPYFPRGCCSLLVTMITIVNRKASCHGNIILGDTHPFGKWQTTGLQVTMAQAVVKVLYSHIPNLFLHPVCLCRLSVQPLITLIFLSIDKYWSRFQFTSIDIRSYISIDLINCLKSLTAVLVFFFQRFTL